MEDFYDSNASFSLSVLESSDPDERDLDAQVLSLDHNLLKPPQGTSIPTFKLKLFQILTFWIERGQVAKQSTQIVNLLKRLPLTTHQMESSANFVFDVFPINPDPKDFEKTLFECSMHGNYIEPKTGTKKSFDRRMVLKHIDPEFV